MSGMEESSGTGSRGIGRVPPAPAPRSLSTADDSRTLPTTHRRCHIALSRCAIDGEARQSLTRMGGAPAGPRRPFPRTPPRTIRTPVGAPLLVGGGVTGSNLRAPRRRPVSSDLGFAHSGGGPRPRRNGGDVHRGRPLNRRRARPPVLNSSCASDPGRSSPIDSEAACRDCLACPVPPL